MTKQTNNVEDEGRGGRWKDGWSVAFWIHRMYLRTKGDFIMRWMQYVVQEERARKGSDGWNIRRGGGGWVFIDSFHRLIGKREKKKKKKKLERKRN